MNDSSRGITSTIIKDEPMSAGMKMKKKAFGKKIRSKRSLSIEGHEKKAKKDFSLIDSPLKKKSRNEDNKKTITID